MWQIEWMLSLIPDSVLMYFCIGLVVLGILFYFSGWLMKLIPGIAGYRLPIRILGIILTLTGVFFTGGYAIEMNHRAQVEELKNKIIAAEQKAQQANENVRVEVVEKVREVQVKGNTIVKEIDRWRDREVIKEVQGPERVRVEKVIEYIENCPVPQEFINIHNDAARMNKKSEGDKK